MDIIKVKSNEELSEKVTEIVVHIINTYSKPILGLATGSSPKKMYKYLVERFEQGLVSFKKTTTFNLDEYVGLSGENPFSYRHYMNEHLFNKVDINPNNIFIPDGLAPDLQSECEQFEQKIAELGPIHLQILGVGLNGHIGFNEPGTSFSSRTHIATLEESTRKANSRFFNHIEEVPSQALTMGIGTIMEAEQIILLVQGEHKKDILQKIIYGDVTEEVPASVLQTHPRATIITDLDV